MLILKRNNGIGEIFNTENIHQSQASTERPGTDKALHHHHKMTDLAFLRQYFTAGHRIFILFEQSYYYLISD